MTDKKYAIQAAAECACEDNVIGKSKPVWNNYAFQFMYAPFFRFPHLPVYRAYRCIAADESGRTYTFDTEKPSFSLSPIWADLPEGVVRLSVNGIKKDGTSGETVGARTFFKLASFPSDLPPASRPYEEAAAMAFEYALRQPFLRHWLTDGTPDPEYDLNVYPSKMISSVIDAMIYYSSVCPEKKDEAAKIAVNAADYLISITRRDGVMKNVPPTYQTDFRCESEKNNDYTASERINQVMMLYPAHVGYSYINLYKFTGNAKYLEEAKKIGAHYKENVLPNGSWYLIKDINTGEVLSPNFCEPLERIVPFLMALYEVTGNETWKTLSDGAIKFIENNELKTFEWEGQFEDSVCSVNYSNLTHYGASAYVRYLARYYADDEEKMKNADELMRFIEDQFIVWKRPAPWNKDSSDTTAFRTPCVYEQYNWYVPIDASAADIISTFLAMYKAGRGELHLEKAKAIADSLTRVQYDDGLIPTHWMTEDMLELPFWINCMFSSAINLARLAEELKRGG